jgi:hypothetical protein
VTNYSLLVGDAKHRQQSSIMRSIIGGIRLTHEVWQTIPTVDDTQYHQQSLLIRQN